MPPEPSKRELAVLERMYRRAAGDLAALLRGTDFQRGRAGVLLAQVRRISKRLGVKSDQWVTRNTAKLYGKAQAWVDSEIKRLGAGTAAAALREPQINERAVGAFATQIARDLAKANGQMRDAASRIISGTGQKILADPELAELVGRGLIAGGSLNKIARGLRTRLTEAGREALESGALSEAELAEQADLEAGYIRAGAKRMAVGRYCELVASYQLREASTHATRGRLREAGEQLGDPMGFDLVMIVGPVSPDFCAFYVGKVFSNSGQHPDYPPFDELPEGGPPFHPHCRHNVAPFIAEFASRSELERGHVNPDLLGVSGRQAQGMFHSPARRYAARMPATGQVGIGIGNRG